jgi:hypothetical protein
VLAHRLNNRVRLHTYVDDRTLIAETKADLKTATEIIQHLDRLSGQQEDAGKEENVCIERGMGNGFLDLLGVRFDVSGEAPAHLAPRAVRRAEELLRRLKRLKGVSRAARLHPQQTVRVVLATTGLTKWDAPWAIMDTKLMNKIRVATETAISGRQRHAAWRHRGAAWAIMKKGWMLDPMGIVMSGIVNTVVTCVRGVDAEAFSGRWRSTETWSGGLVRRARNLFQEMLWNSTEASPRSFAFGRHTVDLVNANDGKIQHHVREAWRAWMVRTACREMRRNRDITVSSLDAKPLEDFVACGQDSRDRGHRWRMVVAAEPSCDRLSYTVPEIPHDCPSCGVPNDTLHYMWVCPATQQIRTRHGLNLDMVDAWWPHARGREAWRCNGWLPADFETPRCRTAVVRARKILEFKLDIFAQLLDTCSGRSAPGDDSRS